MSDIKDLIGFAIDKNPVEFADAFNDIITSKAKAALEDRSITLAGSLYGEEAVDTNEDVDNDSFDFSDEDLSEVEDTDIDLDLEDIDFTDIDSEIEGNNDDNNG